MDRKHIREIVEANNEGISRAALCVSEWLGSFGISKKELARASLLVEEAATCLVRHASEDARIRIQIKPFGGRVSIELSAPGEVFDPVETVSGRGLLDDDMEESAQDVINSMLLKSVGKDYRYVHTKRKNIICLTVYKSPKARLYMTLGVMALAVLVGCILSMIGNTPVNNILDSYILVPIKTMYMNALKMIVAPVVFFSIVSCIAQFTNARELGRIGIRIILMYFLTTLLAIGVGIGLFYVFRPGSPSLIGNGGLSASGVNADSLDISIKNLLVDIVPSNLIQPFLSSNMLQLIFLAVLIGIAVGQLGHYSDLIKNLFEALNELFMKITALIIQIMPIAVFCSVCSLMLETGIKSIIPLLGMFGTFIAGIACMIVVYCLLLLVLGRYNPISFLRIYGSSMLQIFSLASSNASIPINMKACEKLGIPKKLYCLSIPIGATINMDGECIYLSIFALAIAKAYGIEMTGAALISMIVSIIILSMGAPGIPGVGLICLSVLLTQMGVPTETIGIVMGIDAVIGMFRCMGNCTGDVVASMIVAKNTQYGDT